MASHWDMFGLTEQASAEALKKRYKQLSRQCHPDKGGSDALMALINHSYEQIQQGKGQEIAFSPLVSTQGAPTHLDAAKLQKVQRLLEHVRQSNSKFKRQIRGVKLLALSAAAAGLLLLLFVVLQHNAQQEANKLHETKIAQLKLRLAEGQDTITHLFDKADLQRDQHEVLSAQLWQSRQRSRLLQAQLAEVYSELEQNQDIIRSVILRSQHDALSGEHQRYLSAQAIEPKPDPVAPEPPVMLLTPTEPVPTQATAVEDDQSATVSKPPESSQLSATQQEASQQIVPDTPPAPVPEETQKDIATPSNEQQSTADSAGSEQ
ncbi:J domain-containing protein [Aliagarivorans taiwanensis]|uniref:J domain-containing protein n=1 Tax=Aliagarivorans taiwanensis TaxID=561966 RepID=UPI0003F4D741|nr:J domain-containing protein [Aliagarivorans taiwanensis]